MGSPLRRYFEALLLLLLAAGFCTLASTGRLAWPVAALASAAFVGRFVCFARRRSPQLPPRWLLAGLLLYVPVYVCDGLFFSAGFLDATLHLVVLVGAAKLFSMQSGRDYLALGLLAFLEVMAAALLTVSGVFFVLFLCFLALLIAALVAHEMAQAQAASAPLAPGPAQAAPAWPLLRFSLLLSLGVAVITVLVFFLLPRTTLGAWGSHRPASGLSGFSDEVQLGAIANLQRTDNPVMHIRVTSADPPLDPATFQQIPWRGRGLTQFDGKRWYSPDSAGLHGTQSGRLEVSTVSLREPPQIVRYQVTLEPLASPVLFFPARLLRAATHFHLLAWDRSTATLASPGAEGDVYTNFAGTTYSGVSDLARPSEEALRAAPQPASFRLRYQLRPFLQLPDDLDPRIRALAHSIAAHSPLDNWDRMQALTAYLQTHYQYTLTDLPQGSDPLSTFLFDQPAGDCEYFASALAVMARSLDIPTRVVNGFVVGDYNPFSGEYIVRGGDAHSWVEAYFPDAGGDGGAAAARRLDRGTWVSFDATPSGPSDGGSAEAGLIFDALSSFWQERIVNYDWLQQAGLVRRLQSSLGDSATQAWQDGQAAAGQWGKNLASLRQPFRRGGLDLWAAILLMFGVPLGILTRRRGWRWKPGDWNWATRSSPEERAGARARGAYRRFQRYLGRAGHLRTPAQTAEELLAQVAAAHPDSALAHACAGFVANYEALRFGPSAPSATRLAELAGQLGQVRRHCSRTPVPHAAPNP